MPQVLAFQQGGRYIPWYEYNGYDPYNDYWRYENAGWGGFGPGLVAGFVGAELMDDLLMPSYAMGGYCALCVRHGHADVSGLRRSRLCGGRAMATRAMRGDYGGGSDFLTDNAAVRITDTGGRQRLWRLRLG